MKTIFSFFATILFTANAYTQSSSSEVMCRAQAKEAAMQSYSSCITVARNNQVDEIRKNYQKELASVKAKYDRELKKMGAGGNTPAKKSAKTTAPTVKEVKAAAAAKPVKGIAKELPAKTPSEVETMPVQTVSEGTKVVAIEPETSSNAFENEAIDAEKVEIIEMPVE